MTLSHMKRRTFLALSSAPMLAAAVRAQGAKVVHVGFIHGAIIPAWTQSFIARLASLGFIEGKNLRLRIHPADEDPRFIQAVLEQMIRESVDVIVTTGTTATNLAKSATQTIPIVFLAVSDPVKARIVSNLARPEANLTGISNQQGDLLGKRLEFLRELVPDLKSLGVLVNSNNPAGVAEQQGLATLAKPFDLVIEDASVRKSADLPAVFQAIAGKVQALYVFGDYLTSTHRQLITRLAFDYRLPAIYPFKEFVLEEGLISYGPNVSSTFARAADYVVRIVAGTRPADIPVEQPTGF